MNCEFTPGSPFRVYVSKTQDPLSIGGEYPEYFNNATVAIYQGESKLCDLPYATSTSYPFDNYIDEFCLVEAETSYTLKVSTPSFAEVVATGAIPVRTEIRSFEMSDLEILSVSDTVASFQLKLKLILEETLESDSYYLLDFNYEQVPYQVVGNDTIIVRTGIYAPLSLEEQEGNPSTVKHFDEKIGGVLFAKRERGTLELNYAVKTPNPVLLTMDLFDRVYVNLRTISKDYYLYHLQLSRQQLQKDTFFVNPVILADNIENGVGLFAGYQLTRDSVLIDLE